MSAAPATGSGPPAASAAASVPPGSSVTTKQSAPSRPASTTGARSRWRTDATTPMVRRKTSGSSGRTTVTTTGRP